MARSPWVQPIAMDPSLRPTDDYKSLLRCLLTGRGLYFLGAGASAGEAPFGAGLLREVGIDYLQHARSFSTGTRQHSPLSELVLEAGAGVTAFDVYGRELRPSIEDFTQDLLRLMPLSFPRSLLKHQFAVPRYRRRASRNYLPFRFFPPSLIMNYNHDGLASDLVGPNHVVISVHGYVESWIGSPDALSFIRTAGIENDLGIAPDRLLMLEPESFCDLDLARRLMPMAQFKPEFVAIIGYSFAWTGQRHNDIVSLDSFVDHYRDFQGPVFVIDPQPDRLQEILAGRLHHAQVWSVRARWNLLSHAFLEAMTGRLRRPTLNDYCEELFDAGHGWSAFPLDRD